MKKTNFALIILLMILVVTLFLNKPVLGEVQQLQIPLWVKTNAKLWSDGGISESDFIKGLQWLLQNKLIVLQENSTTQSAVKQIPNWIKNVAGWWSDGKISDDDFLKGMKYLIEANIISKQGISPKTGIMIPLYIYPGAAWDKIAAAKIAHPSVPIIAIINPDSGPGTSIDEDYVIGIQKLKAAGVIVLGYVHTNYATRSMSEVMADIDTYKTWYPVDGIKFDQMANTIGFESYYSEISKYAKSRGFTFTAANPGTDVPPSYIGTVDNLTIFERSGLPDISNLEGRYSNYDKRNFTTESYAIEKFDKAFVTEESKYVGYIYLTEDDLPNPYDSLSSYFDILVSALDSDSTPSSSIALTVNSVDLSGHPISGLWTIIQEEGVIVQTGHTPLSYNATRGTTYTITMSNFQNYIFIHWDDGSIGTARTITPTKATIMTAYYRN